MIRRIIECDRCSDWTDGVHGPSITKTRVNAWLNGWACRPGLDLCPRCVEAERAKIQADRDYSNSQTPR